MAQDPLGHTTFTVYFDEEDPTTIALELVSTCEFTGEDFLDRLQDFIDQMRSHEMEMLDQDFQPPTSGH